MKQICVLVAAPPPVIRELGGLFVGEGFEIVGAETYEDAAKHLRESEPDLLLVCYAFDEVRPFRILRHAQEDWDRPDVPRVLVRSLPVPMGKNEEDEIRRSYQAFGVTEFVNLYDQKVSLGVAPAHERFHQHMLDLLQKAATERLA